MPSLSQPRPLTTIAFLLHQSVIVSCDDNVIPPVPQGTVSTVIFVPSASWNVMSFLKSKSFLPSLPTSTCGSPQMRVQAPVDLLVSSQREPVSSSSIL